MWCARPVRHVQRRWQQAHHALRAPAGAAKGVATLMQPSGAWLGSDGWRYRWSPGRPVLFSTSCARCASSFRGVFAVAAMLQLVMAWAVHRGDERALCRTPVERDSRPAPPPRPDAVRARLGGRRRRPARHQIRLRVIQAQGWLSQTARRWNKPAGVNQGMWLREFMLHCRPRMRLCGAAKPARTLSGVHCCRVKDGPVQRIRCVLPSLGPTRYRLPWTDGG